MPTKESEILTREQIEEIRACLSDGTYTATERKDFSALCDMALSALSRQQGEPEKVYCVPVETNEGNIAYTHSPTRIPMADNFVLYTTPALSPAKGAEWQPIATAPKDMRILAFVPWYDTPQCEAGEFKSAYFYPSTRQYPSVIPTHWQPLPLPPKD